MEQAGIDGCRTVFGRFRMQMCAGYRGAFVSDLKEQRDLDADISEKIKPHELEKLPWYWIVERTLS